MILVLFPVLNLFCAKQQNSKILFCLSIYVLSNPSNNILTYDSLKKENVQVYITVCHVRPDNQNIGKHLRLSYVLTNFLEVLSNLLDILSNIRTMCPICIPNP